MNKNEEKIFNKYDSLGYDVIKDGAPDLILLKDGNIEFVEVKYKFDGLNPKQIRAHNLLKKHKVPIRTERVAHIQTSSLFERFKRKNGGEKK